MAAATSLENSTTVRATEVRMPERRRASPKLRAVRAGLAVATRHAPSLAVRWAEGLFLTARRRRRPAWEAKALASATRGSVPYDGGLLPTWTWSPESRRAAARTDAPPTVLLVHGWEGRGAQLASFVPELVARGFRVVAFDAPGHGEATPKYGSFVEHARATLAVAEAIGELYAVIGHSVGGSAALLATRMGLRAGRFAVLGSPRTPNRFVRGFSRHLELDPAIERAMIARLESRYEMRFQDLDVRPDAERLDVPLLVVHDEDDAVVPVIDGVALASSARRGQIRPTTGLGHQRILRDPGVVTDVVAFVAAGSRAPDFAETLDGELFYRDLR
jgi:pimeloyl-ACP methyl ester carboxylesterase